MTTEDVFALYERNKSLYDTCKPKCYDKDIFGHCGCYLDTPVIPLIIGDQSRKCSLQTRIYIKANDQCSICLESIELKSNAYLTPCGHGFHKNCLFKLYEHKRYLQNSSYYNGFVCPLCRSHIPTPYFYCRYPQWNYTKKNYLDLIEEFWLSKDYCMPLICYKAEKPHSLGMQKTCKYCVEYRLFG
jgi:hypothetical protein